MWRYQKKNPTPTSLQLNSWLESRTVAPSAVLCQCAPHTGSFLTFNQKSLTNPSSNQQLERIRGNGGWFHSLVVISACSRLRNHKVTGYFTPSIIRIPVLTWHFNAESHFTRGYKLLFRVLILLITFTKWRRFTLKIEHRISRIEVESVFQEQLFVNHKWLE